MLWWNKEAQIKKHKERFDALVKEIDALRFKLNDVNQKKEFWFNQKEELKKEVTDLVTKAKDIRLGQVNLSEEVGALKIQRNAYNKEVSELISKIKTLYQQREEAIRKYDLRINPSKIKNKIEELEQRIETDVMSFKKEQKLMKHIKKLREYYHKSTEIQNIVNNIHQLSREIEESKAKSQEMHQKILDIAKQDQNGYTNFIESSQNVVQARTEQEKAFKKFLKLKRVFIETNDLLKVKLIEHGSIKRKLGKFNVDVENEILKKKGEEIEEKLREKKKLTKEDLLAYQGLNNIEEKND